MTSWRSRPAVHRLLLLVRRSGSARCAPAAHKVQAEQRAPRRPGCRVHARRADALAGLTAEEPLLQMSSWTPIAPSRSRSESPSSSPRLSCNKELAIASSLRWIARSERSSAFLSRATSTSVRAEIRPAAATSKRSLAPAIRPIIQANITSRQTAKKNGELARNEPYSARCSKGPRSGPSVRSAGCLSVRRASRTHPGGLDAGGMCSFYPSPANRQTGRSRSIAPAFTLVLVPIDRPKLNSCNKASCGHPRSRPRTAASVPRSASKALALDDRGNSR